MQIQLHRYRYSYTDTATQMQIQKPKLTGTSNSFLHSTLPCPSPSQPAAQRAGTTTGLEIRDYSWLQNKSNRNEFWKMISQSSMAVPLTPLPILYVIRQKIDVTLNLALTEVALVPPSPNETSNAVRLQLIDTLHTLDIWNSLATSGND